MGLEAFIPSAMYPRIGFLNLRKSFPERLGTSKAYDTAVVLEWLEDATSRPSQWEAWTRRHLDLFAWHGWRLGGEPLKININSLFMVACVSKYTEFKSIWLKVHQAVLRICMRCWWTSIVCRNAPGYSNYRKSLGQVGSTEEKLYKICSYMIKCSNRFFRIMRGSGVFLSREASYAARQAGDEMNEAQARIYRVWYG